MASWSYGWPGFAAASAAVVMWILLHFSRVMQVMQRAARRPTGSVDSAVMLNARLHAGMALLDVIALARALGQLKGPAGQQPETFRWADTSGATVEAVFSGGRLLQWTLARPETDALPQSDPLAARTQP